MFFCAFQHLVKSIIRRPEWFMYSIMLEEYMCDSQQTINCFTVWLNKTSRCRNVLHGSSEFGHIVGRIRHRSYRRGVEKFSRESKSCAVYNLCCSCRYILLERRSNAEENQK